MPSIGISVRLGGDGKSRLAVSVLVFQDAYEIIESFNEIVSSVIAHYLFGGAVLAYDIGSIAAVYRQQ